MTDQQPLSIPQDSAWRLVDEDYSRRLLPALKREVGPGHKLFELLDHAKVIAADGASDDRLLEIRGDETRLFLVHPTWSQIQSNNPNWPHSQEVTVEELYDVFTGGFWPE